MSKTKTKFILVAVAMLMIIGIVAITSTQSHAEEGDKYNVTPRLVGASWNGDTDYANGNVQDALYSNEFLEPVESRMGQHHIGGIYDMIVNPQIGIVISKDGEKVAEYEAGTFDGRTHGARWLAEGYEDGFPAGEYEVGYGCASIITDEPNKNYIEFGAIDKNHTVGLTATYNFTITDKDVNLYLPVCRYWVPYVPVVKDQYGNPVEGAVVKETGHPSKFTPDRDADDDTNGSVLNPTRRTITTGANGQGESYSHLSGEYNYELTSVPEGYTIKESESSKDFTVGLQPVTYGEVKGAYFTVYKTATYTVHYKDEDGNEIKADKVVTDGILEDEITENAPTIDGYTAKDESKTFKFTEDGMEVTFTYDKIPKYNLTPRLVGTWYKVTDFHSGNVQDTIDPIYPSLEPMLEPRSSKLGEEHGTVLFINPYTTITVKKDGKEVATYIADIQNGNLPSRKADWLAEGYEDGFPAGEYQVSYGSSSIITDEPNKNYIEYGAVDKDYTVGLGATYNFTITDEDVFLYLPVCRYWVYYTPVVKDQFGNPVEGAVVKETGHPSEFTGDRNHYNGGDDDGSLFNPTHRTVTTEANGQAEKWEHLSGAYNYELTSVPEGYTIKESESSKDFTVGLQPIIYAELKGVNFTVYKTATYTVHYKDEDGNEIKADKVVTDGILEDEITENAPTIDGYTAKDESKTFKFTEDGMEVTFTYDINKYNVTFVDADGNELKTEEVTYGSGATAPNPPTKEGYTFKSWDKPFDNVTGDLTVTAEMTKNTYTVTFVDADGNVIKTEKIEYGEGATAPEPPVKEGFTFKGWDKPFDNVTSDLTIKAEYVENPVITGDYTVKYIDEDGNEIAKDKVVKDAVLGTEYTEQAITVPKYTPVKGSETFEFNEDGMTITFTYKKVTHEVIFEDENGNEIKTETVVDGEGATAPKPPVKDGYTFIGWDKTFDNVTSDLIVRPLYKKDEVAEPEKTETTISEPETTLSEPIVEKTTKAQPKKAKKAEKAQKDNKAPQTGDNVWSWVWLIIMLTAMAIIVIYRIMFRKNGKK